MSNTNSPHPAARHISAFDNNSNKININNNITSTVVRTTHSRTDEFPINVGLHQ